ncbi:MAG: Rrf2 family transcriptional regulator [Gammaproteobacteria bacterium]
MRLNNFTDYSLRVLMYLAAEPGRRATIDEIAGAFDISRNHLMKVVQCLGKAGVLNNLRGRGGGLELARAPDGINIGAVVRATEGVARPAECFEREANTCCIVPGCRLRGVLAEAVAAFEAVLERYSLADLVDSEDVRIDLRALFVHRDSPPGVSRG